MTKQLSIAPWLATAAALALAIPVAGSASEPTTPAAPEAVAPAAAPEPALDAAKIAVDPKTGELRQVTAAEDAALRAQMKAFWDQFSTVSHEVKHDRRNGRYSVIVAPTRMRVAIATVTPDGKTVWDCAGQNTDPDQFAAELRAKAAAAQAQQEEK